MNLAQHTPASVQSHAWNNAVASLLGEPLQLPVARASTTHKRPWSVTGKDTGTDLDDLFLQVFGDDTDPQDCQEFDA